MVCCLHYVIAIWSLISLFYSRMNRAQTVGFEKDVGTRTTHHFMYPESAMNLQHGVHLVLVPFKLQDLKWVTSAFSTGELTLYVTAWPSEGQTA